MDDDRNLISRANSIANARRRRAQRYQQEAVRERQAHLDAVHKKQKAITNSGRKPKTRPVESSMANPFVSPSDNIGSSGPVNSSSTKPRSRSGYSTGRRPVKQSETSSSFAQSVMASADRSERASKVRASEARASEAEANSPAKPSAGPQPSSLDAFHSMASQSRPWRMSSVSDSETMLNSNAVLHSGRVARGVSERLKNGYAYHYANPLRHSRLLQRDLRYRRQDGQIRYYLSDYTRGDKKRHARSYYQPRLPKFLVNDFKRLLISDDRNLDPYSISKMSVADICKVAFDFSGVFTPEESDALADAFSTRRNRLISRLQINHDANVNSTSVDNRLIEILHNQERLENRIYAFHQELLKRFKSFVVLLVSDLLMSTDSWAYRVAGYGNATIDRRSKAKLIQSTIRHFQGRSNNGSHVDVLMDTMMNDIAHDVINRMKEKRQH